MQLIVTFILCFSFILVDWVGWFGVNVACLYPTHTNTRTCFKPMIWWAVLYADVCVWAACVGVFKIFIQNSWVHYLFLCLCFLCLCFLPSSANGILIQNVSNIRIDVGREQKKKKKFWDYKQQRHQPKHQQKKCINNHEKQRK